MVGVYGRGGWRRVTEHRGVGWNGVEAHNDEQPCSICAWEEGKRVNLKYVRIKYKLDEKINYVEMIYMASLSATG